MSRNIVVTAAGKKLDMSALKEKNKHVKPITNIKNNTNSNTTKPKKVVEIQKLNAKYPVNAPVTEVVISSENLEVKKGKNGTVKE